MNKIDKFRGCLIGGGAGDALGYVVEFWPEHDIFNKFGKNGITPARLTKGYISDDTQMTLFTAAGLLTATRDGAKSAADYRDRIGMAYLEWLYTQTASPAERHPAWSTSWLLDVPGLYSRRAPGGTCLSALHSGKFGTVHHPINDSKGCGGVMRVAPIGLFFSDPMQAAQVAAEAAAVTHGHELGHMPAAALAAIVSDLTHRNAPIYTAVNHALVLVERLYEGSEHLADFTKLIEDALFLANKGDVSDLQAIHILGEGWVGEEALAIAVYCAVKYSEDFNAAITAAVNHNGDSDSTGAVCGNIVGAHLGFTGIPSENVDRLELSDVILKMAGELYDAAFTSA